MLLENGLFIKGEKSKIIDLAATNYWFTIVCLRSRDYQSANSFATAQQDSKAENSGESQGQASKAPHVRHIDLGRVSVARSKATRQQPRQASLPLSPFESAGLPDQQSKTASTPTRGQEDYASWSKLGFFPSSHFPTAMSTRHSLRSFHNHLILSRRLDKSYQAGP